MKTDRLFLMLAMVVSTMGCQRHLASASAFVPTGELALSLDYSHPEPGMCAPDSESYGDYYCQGGELHLVNTGHDGYAGMTYNPPDLSGLRNFILEAAMQSVDGSGAYGLMFRGNGEGEAYIFRLRSTGAYELIIRWQSGEKILFPWTASPAVHRGTAVNLLEVTAQGNHFTLIANGQALTSVDNGALAEGLPGVVAMDGGHAAVSKLSFWKLP